MFFFYVTSKAPTYARGQTVVAMTGGVVSLFGYGIVIGAMQYDAMGVVSALRETSVLFAALLGKFFLKETLTVGRMASCFAIAIGAACLVH
ncbi:drug/metabolite transporter (DMT)-like permease [Phyllobacterium sp. 1468]|uniref:EamA family transporter n=1 Tax=Phyllobacterium sp. 1468 TaxID=2817759 RepID=UPI0028577002|nr:drug/metabolite transporter (DMT)-like permease [Phyllobacterium sp. 1468]